MSDNFTRPLDSKGKANWEKIFGKRKRQNGVFKLVEAAPGEKRMDADYSRMLHNKHEGRKLEKDEQKFEVPYDQLGTGEHETLIFKKSDSSREKREKIAEAYTRAGKPTTANQVELINE